MIALGNLAPSRPPCSKAERAAANVMGAALRRLGLHGRIEPVRAATSPTWVPLLRALLRVWAVALIAALRPTAAAVLSSIAIVGGLPAAAALVRFLPILGSMSQNVVARVAGTDRDARPIVVVAHLDTHPVAVAPMGRAHSAMGAVFGWLALAAALVGRPSEAPWRACIALVAVEALVTLTWLARRELALIGEMPDDNTSGLLALTRAAALVCQTPPVHDVWIVSTGAGTSGGHGVSAFLRSHGELRDAWVVDLDALGSGEVVASPLPARFPRPGTPPMLVRAVMAAAQATGDPLSVRRLRRAHSDARVALRARRGAITLTAGLRPPEPEAGPDAANAERVARVVDQLARAAA